MQLNISYIWGFESAVEYILYSRLFILRGVFQLNQNKEVRPYMGEEENEGFVMERDQGPALHLSSGFSG